MARLLTQDEFISRAIRTHGDKYDYSLVRYKNYETPVKLICNTHGIFLQKPHAHLDGRGCKMCGGSNLLTIKDFLARAKKVHGNKYNYSRVVYTNSESKIEIICKKHGIFFQRAGSHLRGEGCSACSGTKKLTTKIFIERANKVHNGFYDYGNLIYKNSTGKVNILCRTHGEFKQTAIQHLRGAGCPKCSIIKKLGFKSKHKTLTEDFIHNSKLKHGDKFDYSRVVYSDSSKPITIGCAEHGFVKTLPLTHLKGDGCPQCAIIKVGDKKKKEFKTFIKEAIKAHGKKYEYREFEHYKSRTPIEIYCKKHGWFTQLAYAHLRGQGCPQCKESYGERLIRLYLTKRRISFNYQKSFPDCRNKLPLYFDFYIKSRNILIEFDGEQHYQLTRNMTFGGHKVFERIKQNDKIKNEYADKKGIRLLRIKHTEIKNIKNILDKELEGTTANKMFMQCGGLVLN